MKVAQLSQPVEAIMFEQQDEERLRNFVKPKTRAHQEQDISETDQERYMDRLGWPSDGGRGQNPVKGAPGVRSELRELWRDQRLKTKREGIWKCQRIFREKQRKRPKKGNCLLDKRREYFNLQRVKINLATCAREKKREYGRVFIETFFSLCSSNDSLSLCKLAEDPRTCAEFFLSYFDVFFFLSFFANSLFWCCNMFVTWVTLALDSYLKRMNDEARFILILLGLFLLLKETWLLTCYVMHFSKMKGDNVSQWVTLIILFVSIPS